MLTMIIAALVQSGRPHQALFLQDLRVEYAKEYAQNASPEETVWEIGCYALIGANVSDAVFDESECMEY